MSDIEGVDILWDAVRLSADDAAIKARDQTQAKIIEVAVKSALNCLLGNGLVTLVPTEEWPMWLTLHPEEELSHD